MEIKKNRKFLLLAFCLVLIYVVVGDFLLSKHIESISLVSKDNDPVTHNENPIYKSVKVNDDGHEYDDSLWTPLFTTDPSYKNRSVSCDGLDSDVTSDACSGGALIPMPESELSINLDKQRVLQKSNFWTILDNALECPLSYSDPEESSHAIDSIKDEFKAMSPEELQGIGVVSGDVSVLFPGSEIEIRKKIENSIKTSGLFDDSVLKKCYSYSYETSGRSCLYQGATFFSKNDSEVCYGEGAVLEEARPGTFKPLDCEYGKDGSHVYYQNHKVNVNGAIPDMSTFQLLYYRSKVAGEFRPTTFAKDKNKVYIFDYFNSYDCGPLMAELDVLDNADPTSFEVIDEHYAKDSKNVYYYYQEGSFFECYLLNRIDPSSFEILHDGYFRDKNHTERITVDINKKIFSIENAKYIK